MGIEFEDTIHIQPEVSGTSIDAYTKEETDTLLDNRIEPIEEVIPSNASSSNQLATINDIPDLTNYYNKTQTDTLLDGKEDAFILEAPLAIEEYQSKPVLNRITDTGTTLYVSDQTTIIQYYFNEIVSATNTVDGMIGASNRTQGTTPTTLDEFWSCGYVELPFHVGQRVTYATGTEAVFGKYNAKGEFVAVATPAANTEILISQSDKYTISGNAYSTQLKYDKINIIKPPSTLVTVDYGYGVDIEESNGTIIMRVPYTDTSARIATVTEAEDIARLKEITTVRICPTQSYMRDSSKAVNKSAFGLYDLSDTSTNLIDFNASEEYTVLGIKVGDGLDFKGGQLINEVADVPDKVTTLKDTQGTRIPDIQLDGTTVQSEFETTAKSIKLTGNDGTPEYEGISINYTGTLSETGTVTKVFNTFLNQGMTLATAQWMDNSTFAPVNLADYGITITETGEEFHQYYIYLTLETKRFIKANVPTISFVPTTSTEYGSLTPDSGTLYIITDTGAIYLGTTLIAQKNT